MSSNDIYFNALASEVYNLIIEKDKNKLNEYLYSLGVEIRKNLLASLFRTNYDESIQKLIAQKINSTL